MFFKNNPIFSFIFKHFAYTDFSIQNMNRVPNSDPSFQGIKSRIIQNLNACSYFQIAS